MILLVFFASFAFSVVLAALTLRLKSANDRFIVLVIYHVLLLLLAQIMLMQLLGYSWPWPVQIGAFVFIAVYWLRQILVSSFWGKLLFQTLLILHLFLGGYLYANTQMPYSDRPFTEISMNGPLPLAPDTYNRRQISGLPADNRFAAPVIVTEKIRIPIPTGRQTSENQIAIAWNDIEPLMQKDSHIRAVMHQLKEEQERALSDQLTRLNAASAESTQMRRNALSTEQAHNLLDEQAISAARFQTMMETWRLLDHDEKSFRNRQVEARFYALLELLEDDKVDETNKIDFIRFMTRHFSGDVRLIKPLIRLYARLDDEYPRQKRLNRIFMNLYLARREALIDAFKAIGKPALQPLLDFRSLTVSHIGYSQARLDTFLQQYFGARFRPLYGIAAGQSIPDFLNRQKYPPLGKLSGASFEQDIIRRSLLDLAKENTLPQPEQPVMGLNQIAYRSIVEQLPDNTQGMAYPAQLDQWLIDPEPSIRANLAWRLANLKSPYSLPLIFDLMKDPHPEVRRYAAIAVGNFRIIDAQGANDQKFIEILRMLQNYRSNSDSFARGWAVLALASTGDKQKALYALDLLLNDGVGSNSIVGMAATTWRSEEEQHVLRSWTGTLQETPEDPWVKTQALNALIAIDSPESLDILLHYLHHVYQTYDSRPSLWRYAIPHLTLPQEAENAEDVVLYLAQKHRNETAADKQALKALRLGLSRAYQYRRSGEFFQILDFLRDFDSSAYRHYLAENDEQIRIMRIWEYTHATYGVWLVCWPISLICMLVVNYSLLPLLSVNLPARGTRFRPNQRANPAADSRNKAVPPPSAIVPVKINKAGA